MTFPDIDPVALSLGPIEIRWYALAYLAGFLIGWRYALRLAGKDTPHRPDRTDIDDLLIWIIPGVILGGRIGYVLFYQTAYYLEYPMEILKVWQGGMSFHGGAIGVILAMILFSWRRKINAFAVADIVCCAVPIGLFFGRIANFVNGELYGRITTAPVGVVFPMAGPDPRHPSQIYEAFFEGAVLFMIMFILARQEKWRQKAGFLSGVFLAGYGIFRFFIEYTRAPDAHLGLLTLGLSMGQWLCIPMVLAGLVLIYLSPLKLFNHSDTENTAAEKTETP